MKTPGLSDLRLKVLGLIFVVMSAFGTAFVRRGMPSDLAQASMSQLTATVLLETISWIAFPLYAYLLVSGFTHTSSLIRYGVRLLVLAIVAEVPYDLATTGKVWDLSSQNPVFALLITLIVLYAIDRFSASSRDRYIAFSIMITIAGMLWILLLNTGLRLGLMPGGVVILLFAIILRYLARRENIMNLLGGVLGALAGIFPAFGLAILHYRNGEQGFTSQRVKWFFYADYPACLLVIGLAGILS